MANLPASTRFVNYGQTHVYFLPAIAATTLIPTTTEITAGTDLTAEVQAMSGWTVTGATVQTPDLATNFERKITGRTSSPDSSLTFYADQAGVDVRSVLSFKQSGFIVFADNGIGAAKKVDSYATTVTSIAATRSVADQAMLVMVMFAITQVPALNVAMVS